jgi:hypothetical protein
MEIENSDNFALLKKNHIRMILKIILIERILLQYAMLGILIKENFMPLKQHQNVSHISLCMRTSKNSISLISI